MERTLKYLLFLVPAEKLYPVAMGMYNLPLALSVARRSTMDPADYTAFLSQLYGEPSLARQRHLIDDHLQRYDRAWRHLHEAQGSADFDTVVLSYIKRHQLYSSAFEYFSTNKKMYPIEFCTLCKVYAAFESSRDHHYAAVDLLTFAEEKQSALEAAIQCGYWQKVLMNSNGNLARDMKAAVVTLCQQKRLREAFTLAEKHLDIMEAVEIGIQGHFWTDVNRIILINNCNDESVSRLIDTALKSQIDVLQGVHANLADFREKSQRLKPFKAVSSVNWTSTRYKRL